jgi:predicted anti-sigma-YlaC factor YlaD
MHAVSEVEECTRARLVLSLALDGEASEADALAAADSHLASCTDCRGFGARVAAITDELRSFGGTHGVHEPVEPKGARS